MKSNAIQRSSVGMRGFTLLELAIVLAVIAAMLGGAIALMSAAIDSRSYNSSLAKLRILQKALLDYRIAYNRLPCPANSSAYTTTDADFGVEAANSNGYCGGGAPAADAGQATAAAAIGMVPVRTLGLPDDMAIDSWGRRIRYAVSSAFVISEAFDGVAATSTTTRLTIKNNNTGDTIATTAAYALVSYGANGHGGRGGTKGTLVTTGMTNSNELLNCKCTNTGAYDAAYDSSADLAVFSQGDPKPDPSDPLNAFDDITVFATRVDLRDADE